MGSEKDLYNDLNAYMDGGSVINTHAHHRGTAASLDQIFLSSYVNWCGVSFGATDESKAAFLEKIRYRSYYVWLQKALQSLYQFDEPISAANWPVISGRISRAHESRQYDSDVLKQRCKYEKILLDAYWHPGYADRQGDLFKPVFRINSFLFGYNKRATDHNGNNAQVLYQADIQDIDAYVGFMRETILKKKQDGCVALKSALAYDRSLDFAAVSKDRAQKGLRTAGTEPEPGDVKAFGDYIFAEICRAAADFDLPLQCHTGLGLLDKTSAIYMREIIVRNPDTKFILFHGSYPWLDDLLGLVHQYKNVFPDLCWLPLITPAACSRFLAELLEVSTIDKICWGCDTWTSEESLGSLMAMKTVLAGVLAQKIKEGVYSADDAKTICRRILYNNAKTLYRLDGPA